jgi:hypothetical protein
MEAWSKVRRSLMVWGHRERLETIASSGLIGKRRFGGSGGKGQLSVVAVGEASNWVAGRADYGGRCRKVDRPRCLASFSPAPSSSSSSSSSSSFSIFERSLRTTLSTSSTEIENEKTRPLLTTRMGIQPSFGFLALGIIIIVFMIIIVRIADGFNSGNGSPTAANGFTLSR